MSEVENGKRFHFDTTINLAHIGSTIILLLSFAMWVGESLGRLEKLEGDIKALSVRMDLEMKYSSGTISSIDKRLEKIEDKLLNIKSGGP